MYVPLYVKTDYSLLSSLIKIDNLIEHLKKKNITSCAIVDNNLFGTMEIINKFNKNGIKPIIGLEITFNEKKVLLYAKNEKGYKNLVKIETIKNENDITLDILASYSSDLIVIIFDVCLYDSFKTIYEDLFIGVYTKNEELEKSKIGPTVYANKTLYLEKYEYKYLPYVFMIRDGKTISDGIDFIYQNNHLLSYDEIVNLVSIDSINNTLKISEMCNLSLSNNLYMPKYDVENSKEFLINLANKGLNKRLGNVPLEYQKRLDYELDVILKMHFEDYFLVVYDYVRYAKKNGVLVGPGRGSAAGSLVSYCLGITDVDPIKYSLLFERFLNPERITMPDIDTDFSDVDRDKVINYVKEKYGENNVAGIITFGTLAPKQAIRDVGRVLNISLKDIDYITKNLGLKETLKDLRNRNKEINNLIESSDKLKMLSTLVNMISNNKRHTSIHAAGIVISREKLDNILPIIRGSEGLYLTEYTMEYLEELGLIKMDFLGIKNLSTIKNIISDIKKYEGISIDFNNIPLDDKKVLSVFAEADTTGIFQFESEGMKRFLKDLKPNSFEDICTAIALYRPGPAENIPTFINRRNKKENVNYINDVLKPILEETYGIIIYQEQIMLIANVMASYTFGEADILRRAMSKKKYDVLKSEEERFIKGAMNNNYTKEEAQEVYDLILKFANYGFNKSHSVSYSLVAYKMAYLKYYFPKYFYANLLSGVVGSETKTIEYLNEIKKRGIKVLAPDVNKSDNNKYKVTEEGIVMPISSIRNIGGVISNFIVENRENPYVNIYDFLRRNYTKVNNKKVLESLIYSHFFDSFMNMKTLINNIDSILNYIELTNDLKDYFVPKPELTNYEEFDIDEILEFEKSLFGFYLTSHKTEKYKLNDKVLDISMLTNYFNKRVVVIGLIDSKKEIVTKKGETMCFLNVSDNTGSISVTLFPFMYRDFNYLKKGDIIKISGIVEKRFNEYQLVAKDIYVLKK